MIKHTWFALTCDIIQLVCVQLIIYYLFQSYIDYSVKLLFAGIILACNWTLCTSTYYRTFFVAQTQLVLNHVQSFFITTRENFRSNWALIKGKTLTLEIKKIFLKSGNTWVSTTVHLQSSANVKHLLVLIQICRKYCQHGAIAIKTRVVL